MKPSKLLLVAAAAVVLLGITVSCALFQTTSISLTNNTGAAVTILVENTSSMPATDTFYTLN